MLDHFLQISIALSTDWYEPIDSSSSSAEDIEAAMRAQEFRLGWFANPIFVNGNYPEVMHERVAMPSVYPGVKGSNSQLSYPCRMQRQYSAVCIVLIDFSS